MNYTKEQYLAIKAALKTKRKMIVEMAQRHPEWTITELARRYDVTVGTASYYLHSAGIWHMAGRPKGARSKAK